jgi:hypothetical protein
MPELVVIESRSRWRRPAIDSNPSRPPTPPLERLYSGQHLDDHSYYHHSDHHEYSEEDSLSTLATERTREEQNKDDERAGRDGQEAALELRKGVDDEHDLDGAPSLAKQTTSRSMVKPENLVSTSFFEIML